MKKKSKLTLATLKYNAMKLRAKSQIPYYLAYYISELTNDSSIQWINYLKVQSVEMIRVPGYYSTHPDVADTFDKLLIDAHDKLCK